AAGPAGALAAVPGRLVHHPPGLARPGRGDGHPPSAQGLRSADDRLRRASRAAGARVADQGRHARPRRAGQRPAGGAQGPVGQLRRHRQRAGVLRRVEAGRRRGARRRERLAGPVGAAPTYHPLMSSPSSVAESPITDRRELVEYLSSGARPRADWRIGTEHEKFGFRLDDLRPPTFDGERGIEALLTGLTRFGWQPVQESVDGKPARTIALLKDGASVTLEPAGQLELSGAQLQTIHQTCCEVESHLHEVRSVADEIGLGFLGMGFQPKWARADMPWMPKGRYRIMREYMPKVGSLGLDMMTRTCTVQVNLDVGSEADMVKKFRVRSEERRVGKEC